MFQDIVLRVVIANEEGGLAFQKRQTGEMVVAADLSDSQAPVQGSPERPLAEAVPDQVVELPPEVKHFSGLYRFINPEEFASLGVDPADVPLGTFPALDHPPFLPDRMGGNAYGLGIFEHGALDDSDTQFLDNVDLSTPESIAPHHARVNEILKRQGLLVRFARTGNPYYLIPRRFVAHFLVEVKSQADEIVEFLAGLPSRLLRENVNVGLVSMESGLLVEEVQSRLPHLEFSLLRKLDDLIRPRRPLAALVVVGEPRRLAMGMLGRLGLSPAQRRERSESLGYFLASRFHDLLEEGGELIVLADNPLATSRENLDVTFLSPLERKRFLLFGHVFRTRRRYLESGQERLNVNRFDFNSFLTGLGVYHETVEGMLAGKSLGQLTPEEIDRLPHQDLPLPRGSSPRMSSAWERWFSPFFHVGRLGPKLPEEQKKLWASLYRIAGGFPETLLVLTAKRRRPSWTLRRLRAQGRARSMAGCDRTLLADYKDTFTYVLKVLDILNQIKEGRFQGLPALELSRLRKPFETPAATEQINDVLAMMEMAPRLARFQGWLNPEGVMGPHTPLLENLHKLALLGAPAGVLEQLSLVVLGHSAMSRVTFGKLPEGALSPVTELGRYRDVDQAVAAVRLYRLLSVAELMAASPGKVTVGQVKELLSLADDAIRLVSDPEVDWPQLVDEQIGRLGGLSGKATRKLLKLFNHFDYLNNWREVVAAGSHSKQAMADYDPVRLSEMENVLQLVRQADRFLSRYYPPTSSARPYFLRALLECELHGTGRLLPLLKPRAGFVLMWVSVHLSQRLLINFNPLLKAETAEEVPRRIDKLSRILGDLTPEELSPLWLAGQRARLADSGQAVLRDTGVYFVEDPTTGALTPMFMEVDEELARLERDVKRLTGRDLEMARDEDLAALDSRVGEAARLLGALVRRSEAGVERRRRQAARMGETRTRLLDYFAASLSSPVWFSARLSRLARLCPNLTVPLLRPDPAANWRKQRLAAAEKLSALFSERLDLFQDLSISLDLARAEFGPNAVGGVGVTAPQFRRLVEINRNAVAKEPELPRLMAAAVMQYGPLAAEPGAAGSAPPGLARHLNLSDRGRVWLDQLLAHLSLPAALVRAEAPPSHLDRLADLPRPLLAAVFLLSVITTAAGREGVLTEDLLDSFLETHAKTIAGSGAKGSRAMAAICREHARQALAFAHYQDINQGEAPTASLQHLLDTTELPSGPERDSWLAKGCRRAAMDRLIRLKGLTGVRDQDLMLFAAEVPPKYIYLFKQLRSMGVSRFERQLHEARRLAKALAALPAPARELLHAGLFSQDSPLAFLGFAPAAEKLTYRNQLVLLLLGIAAARQSAFPVGAVSFLPLGSVIQFGFELLNRSLGRLDPKVLAAGQPRVGEYLKERGGLALERDRDNGLVKLSAPDPMGAQNRIAALSEAKTPAELKRLYHAELKELTLTDHHTLNFQKRLDAAFNDSLGRMGRELLSATKLRLEQEEDLDVLQRIFEEAWEDGLELPLKPESQHHLRGLYEANLERIRGRLLADITQRLEQVRSKAELAKLWASLRESLPGRRRHLGKDFELMVAQRFDQKDASLN